VLFLKFLQKHLSSDLSLLPDYQTMCLHKTVECSVRFVKKAVGVVSAKGRTRGPQGRKRWWGCWGGGQRAPSHQLKGLGERCKLPQWGPGQSPGRQSFWGILLLMKLVYTYVIAARFYA